ncbi:MULTISPECIES: hypothetical protein [Halomonadaceae]|uniref:hypothetical protein n=1 Tax=Halomonadaceae TaxID=28256 RepID=UPI0012F02F15|nr:MULTISPECIES: hypothetical protein [Halomonas]CAD5263645.1 conserved hypothetical protein [Halomonas sp. 113]CAD5265692.1 conserved hypothetical protein [Halomonas sp. 59]CAD5278446.1 conserved hypothetical protein [Halomonas sp. I3]CAD5284514.1 conserved hypothetical protein [Halomonas sp. 156]VXB55353.1 conserved hypothetical protein [Halomonas titanicae]
MTDIKASDAGEALKIIAHKLNNVNVIEPEGLHTLLRVVRDLKAGKRNQHWLLDVDRGNPIKFKKGITSDGKFVRPKIDFAKIRVNQSYEGRPPFESFDLAMVLEDDAEDILSRWHIDLANNGEDGFQTGPLFHLQFGGRNNGFDRAHDHPVKEPRWCHPPMELALMSEMIVANFFEQAWHTLSNDPSWCTSICLFQKLCYESYLLRLQKCLDAPSGSTILKHVWASNWS